MKTLLALFLFLGTSFDASAFIIDKQDSLRSRSDSLYRSAENFLNLFKLKDAEECYQSLVDQLNDPRGYAGLGKIDLIRDDWTSARHHFDTALELDPGDVESHYYSAVAYRDEGRWGWEMRRQQGISAEFAYQHAEKSLRWILDRDSTYKDVLYQYALLMRYQERYGQAMSALCAQLRLKPDLPLAWLGLVRLVRAATHAEHTADLRSRIAFAGRGMELYLRGEEMRLGGMLQEAEESLTKLLQAPDDLPEQLALLSLVRIYAKRGDFKKMEQTYWKAVRGTADATGAALVFDDLKYIVGPQEVFSYSVQSLRLKRDEFFPSFWNRRNPIPASPSNPRLQEHYRRLVYAEENYYIDRERFSFYSDKGNPGVDFEYKDIGRVYLRQGPPDEMTVQSDTRPTAEVWHYNATAEIPELTFQFFGAQKNFAPRDGLFGRAPLDAQEPIRFSALDGSAGTGGNVQAQRPELSVLAFWDPNYFELWRARSGAGRDVANRAERRISENTARSFAGALTTERHNWDESTKILEFPNAISAFRSRAGKSLVEFAYLIPVRPLLIESASTGKDVKIESEYAVYDKQWRKISGGAETLAVAAGDTLTAKYFRYHKLYLKPDSFHIAMFARASGTTVLGRSESFIGIPDFSRAGLSISDVQLAVEIKPDSLVGMFDKDGWRVVPNPINRHSIEKPFFAYFEIYNASRGPGAGAQVDLDLSIRSRSQPGGLISRIAGLFGGTKGYFVTSEVDKWTASGALMKALTMDVTRMSPGSYELEIKATDRMTGQ